ncbi:hypothetical protein ACFFUB_09350 [Algimonas porphyrae]|nr:hypothetical protein [Algimonas porphyrae]
MILRRLKAHVEKENWFAVGIDFCIVVIGVFVGIQLGNWNEARQDKIAEAGYIERLDLEMDVIRARLTDGEAVYRNSVENIDLLLDARRAFHRGEPDEIPDDDILQSAASSVTSGRVPAGSPAAFKEMVANGALETLRSEDLRQALFAYDEFSAVARDSWRTIREAQTWSANRVTGLIDYDLNTDVAPATSDIGDALRFASFDRDLLLNDSDVKKALNILIRTQINQQYIVAQQLALANDIEVLLAEERAR